MPTIPNTLGFSTPSDSTYDRINLKPRSKQLEQIFQYFEDLISSPFTSIYDDHVLDRRMSATKASQSLYTSLQKRIIQTIATVTSCLALVATVITFYWFCKMQKRLRHKLIMMSIFGCFIRGLWYFIYSLMVMGHKPVSSGAAFCQASGLFIQIANEITDFSTLFIAIHGALQIFRPSIGGFDSGDGLYHFRKYVYAAIFTLPVVLGTLAFANANLGYTAQGAFCGLPVQPIFWRLGLAWIPRYIIASTVTGLAIAVYVYVEWKFRAFSKASRRASSLSISNERRLSVMGNDINNENVLGEVGGKEKKPAVPSLRLPSTSQQDGLVAAEAQDVQSPREVTILVNDELEQASKDYVPNLVGRKQSVCTTSTTLTTISEKSSSSKRPNGTLHPGNLDGQTTDTLPPLASSTDLSTLQSSLTSPAASESQNFKHRRQLRRQLRLVFVYPIVYVTLWIPPMVLNTLQFWPRYQTHMPSWLSITATLCLTLMGFVDCLVFLWREKPWLKGADTSHVLPLVVKRSSCFGKRRCKKDDEDIEAARSNSIPIDPKSTAESVPVAGTGRQGSQDTLNPLSSTFKINRLRFSKGSSESRSIARERALERLALEREDQNMETRISIESQPSHGNGGDTDRKGSFGRLGRREWWDRKDSLFRKDSPFPPTSAPSQSYTGGGLA